MPRVKSLSPTAEMENAVREWIRFGVKSSDIKTQKALCQKIDMPISTFDQRIARPETFRMKEIWRIERYIGKFSDYLAVRDAMRKKGV